MFAAAAIGPTLLVGWLVVAFWIELGLHQTVGPFQVAPGDAPVIGSGTTQITAEEVEAYLETQVMQVNSNEAFVEEYGPVVVTGVTCEPLEPTPSDEHQPFRCAVFYEEGASMVVDLRNNDIQLVE